MKPGQIIDALGAVQYIKMELEKLGLTYKTEHQFASPRKWRFDIILPKWKIAIEYEGAPSKGKGGRPIPSGHLNYWTGYSSDCEKYSAASIKGWVLIRSTWVLLENGTTFRQIREALESADHNTKPKSGGQSPHRPKRRKPGGQGARNDGKA